MSSKTKIPAILSFICDVCKNETTGEDYPGGWHRITACKSWQGNPIMFDACPKHFDGAESNTLGIYIQYRIDHANG